MPDPVGLTMGIVPEPMRLKEPPLGVGVCSADIVGYCVVRVIDAAKQRTELAFETE